MACVFASDFAGITKQDFLGMSAHCLGKGGFLEQGKSGFSQASPHETIPQFSIENSVPMPVRLKVVPCTMQLFVLHALASHIPSADPC